MFEKVLMYIYLLNDAFLWLKIGISENRYYLYIYAYIFIMIKKFLFSVNAYVYIPIVLFYG